MRRVVEKCTAENVEEIKKHLLDEALKIHAEDKAICRKMGDNGAELLQDGMTVLTHCNAGGLATADFGTALGVIYAAQKKGKKIRVIADETRPLLQGARLTAWELIENGIETTLICDNMAAWVMCKGMVDCVIVGADRIARNGDVANKIGTYGVAISAKAHGIPFYVVAPFSTIDMNLSCGEDIPIEERRPEEVVSLAGRGIAPESVRVYNPAFDVTPHEYVTAIVSEWGVARDPYHKAFSQWAGSEAVDASSSSEQTTPKQT
jgi:methylthioribose-1-phosphate isomerase